MAAATSIPAKYWGLLQLGGLGVGKNASFLVTKSNSLIDLTLSDVAGAPVAVFNRGAAIVAPDNFEIGACPTPVKTAVAIFLTSSHRITSVTASLSESVTAPPFSAGTTHSITLHSQTEMEITTFALDIYSTSSLQLGGAEPTDTT